MADALGITVDDLQAAYQTARDAAIDKAVEVGLITQERADEMKVWDGFGRRGGFGGLGRLPKGVANGAIDDNALLADALGITVDVLQSARETANQAAIDQAIAEGLITQEQADAMAEDGHGFGMMPCRMHVPGAGRDGGRGRGGYRGGGAPVAPDTDDSSGTGFRSPSRTTLDAGSDA